jgi:hypothetical protein
VKTALPLFAPSLLQWHTQIFDKENVADIL